MAVRSSFSIGNLTFRKISRLYETQRSNQVLTRLLCTTANEYNNILTTDIPEFTNVAGLNNHQDLYNFSLTEYEKFWATLARSRLNWYKQFDEISNCDMDKGLHRWFLNGKLNVSGNIGETDY